LQYKLQIYKGVFWGIGLHILSCNVKVTVSKIETFLQCSNLFCFLGLRQDEEPWKRHRVHLAEGKVFESALPDEGDVQQLWRGGRRLGSARGERAERQKDKKDREIKRQKDRKTERHKNRKTKKDREIERLKDREIEGQTER